LRYVFGVHDESITSCADSQKVASKKKVRRFARTISMALEQMQPHGDRLLRRGVRIASLDVAGKRHGIQEQAADAG
jgi:hypothetical protein